MAIPDATDGGTEPERDRDAELGALAATCRERAEIADAWLAKSFTDRVLVIDCQPDATLPAALRCRLAARGCHGANEVYGTDREDPSRIGTVDGHDRHRFVDVRTRGEHQSYVVD